MYKLGCKASVTVTCFPVEVARELRGRDHSRMWVGRSLDQACYRIRYKSYISPCNNRPWISGFQAFLVVRLCSWWSVIKADLYSDDCTPSEEWEQDDEGKTDLLIYIFSISRPPDDYSLCVTRCNEAHISTGSRVWPSNSKWIPSGMPACNIVCVILVCGPCLCLCCVWW